METQNEVQKPSMGRVVIYNHPGSADGKYPPIKSPAIVQRVCLEHPGDTENEYTVDLFVMSNTGGIFFAKGIKYGEEGSHWNWPHGFAVVVGGGVDIYVAKSYAEASEIVDGILNPKKEEETGEQESAA